MRLDMHFYKLEKSKLQELKKIIYEKSTPLKGIFMKNENLKDIIVYKLYSLSCHPILWISYNPNIKRLEVNYDGFSNKGEDINSILKGSFKDIIFEKVKNKSWTFATNIDLVDKKDLDIFVDTLWEAYEEYYCTLL